MAKIISSLPGSGAGILSRTSQLINDGSDNTSTYVETDELGNTAFSNDYNDLDNLPIIGNGVTNLDYVPFPINGIVTSDTGTDAIIPLADVTNAGLISAAEKAKLATALQPSDITNLVPYTGATTNTDLGEYQLKAGQVEFDQTPTGTAGIAKLRWNDTDGTLDLGLKGGNVTLQVGQEQVVRIVNKTGTNLLESAYQVVYISGAQGNRLKVNLALANSDLTTSGTIGLVTETINNNQEGFITSNGLVRGINTTGSLQGETWADGDVLYVSASVAGKLTNVKPIAPQHTVTVGILVSAHATQGSIFVKVDNGYELEELHNVLINTPLNNDALVYETSSGLWKNKTISTALGYTPENVANKSDSYTASSSITYASTKALVDGLDLKAVDANVLHKTGEETIGLGEKYFTDNVNFADIAVSGQATGMAAVFPNEFVIKSQLDLKAPLSSPTFTGTPTAPTPPAGTNTTQIATTAFVQDNLDAIKDKLPVNYAKVVYINATSTIFDLANPPVTNDNSLKNDTANLYIAYDGTMLVYNGYSYVAKVVPASSNFFVEGTTLDADSNKNVNIQRVGSIKTSQSITAQNMNSSSVTANVITISNTAQFRNSLSGIVDLGLRRNTAGVLEIYDGVTSDGAIGNRRDLLARNIIGTTYAGGATLTGTPTAPTAAAGTNTTQLATTAFVTTADNLKANIASPALTGNPTAPTPPAGDNDTSIATTAFVTGAIATADAGNVKLTGNQNIGGTKTFLSAGNAIIITGSSSSAPAADFYATLNNPNALAYSFLIDVAAGVTSPTVFAIRNGSDKFWINKSGDVTANNVTLNSVLKLKSYTVATLPTGTVGDIAYVTDALAPTYNDTVVGGGAIRVPVFYNGTNWTAH